MQQVQNEAYSLTDELRRIQKDEKTSAAQRAVRAREIARRDTETLLKKTDAKAAARKGVCAFEGGTNRGRRSLSQTSARRPLSPRGLTAAAWSRCAPAS